MTWSNAQSHAARALSVILERAPRGAAIQLADYDLEETYIFLKGNPEAEAMPYGFHKMVLRALKRMLRREGYTVHLVTVTLEGYMAFRARYNLADSPSNRAQYIGWLTAPQPRPTPI